GPLARAGHVEPAGRRYLVHRPPAIPPRPGQPEKLRRRYEARRASVRELPVSPGGGTGQGLRAGTSRRPGRPTGLRVVLSPRRVRPGSHEVPRPRGWGLDRTVQPEVGLARHLRIGPGRAALGRTHRWVGPDPGGTRRGCLGRGVRP